MPKTKLVKLVIFHSMLAGVFMLLALGATGLGFKDNLSAFDYFYMFFSVGGAAILTFPIWVVSFIPKVPEWVFYTLIPIQIAISYFQVKLAVYIYNRWFNKLVVKNT